MTDVAGHLGDVEIAGRETELGLLGGFVRASRRATRGLVLEGQSGIGKTTLWGHTLARCRRDGWTVLVTRPAPEEITAPLSGLMDLLEHLDPDESRLRSDDSIVRGRAVLAALREAAGRGPLLIAVDDLQWLDSASVRGLRYALRRLDAEPVGVLGTLREDAGTDPLDLAALLPPDRTSRVTVGPLSAESLRAVVGRYLDHVSPRTLQRILELSGGNPLFALELARALASEGSTDRSGSLPPPASVRASIERRLLTVPSEFDELLSTVSALGRARVGELRTLLPDVDLDELLARARVEQLLEIDDDLEVRFVHPMIASVVYHVMDPLARRTLHRRLADHLTDPDVRAFHLARCTDEPDRDIARLLGEAADRAQQRGANGVAADLASHAVRLAPADAPGLRQEQTIRQVRCLAAAGESRQALSVADALVDSLPPGPGRVAALVERAQLEDDDLARGEELLVRALDEAGDDAVARGRVLDQLGWLRGVFMGDLTGGIEYAREALRAAERSGDAEFEMSALAGLSNMLTLAGEPSFDLMDRAVALEDEVGRPPLWSGPKVLMGEQLLWHGELAAARTLTQDAVVHAERRGNERWRAYSLYDLGAIECAAGNLRRADELLDTARRTAHDCEDPHVESWIFYRSALNASWLGRSQQARAAAARRLELATSRRERSGIARTRCVLGLLALAERDVSEAARELVTAAELLTEMGFGHPGAIPGVPDAVEALVLAGDQRAAGRWLDTLQKQAEGLGAPWVDAALRRAQGTVAFGSGEHAEAVAALHEAAVEFARLGYRPDSARARLLLGRACLRAGRRTAAAEAFSDAADSFAEMDAMLWQAQAAELLERAAPGRATGDLTTTERQIAALVVRGATNREIATALFVSVATVEAHLTRTYRKLGIRSRSELTRMVVEGVVDVSDADDVEGHP